MDSLAPELVSCVISFFCGETETDRETLRNLSLTAISFIEPCQAILFYHINITHKPRGRNSLPGAHLLHFLVASPQIARYIKSLTITDADMSWLSRDEKLAEALRKVDLEKIERFSIRLGYGNGWVDILPTSKAAIQAVLQSASLTHLLIRKVPLQLVGLCSSALKHLDAREPLVDNMNGIPPTHRRSPIILRSLVLFYNLDHTIEYLLDDTNQVNVDYLSRAQIFAGNPGEEQMSRLIDSCRGSLKTFVFGPKILREC